MEKGPRAKRKQVSVADAMDRVRWDYRPRGDEGSSATSAGDFFDSFPWGGEADGKEEPEADAGDENASADG